MGFSPEKSFNTIPIENAKKQEMNFFNFRLILLDRITYGFHEKKCMLYYKAQIHMREIYKKNEKQNKITPLWFIQSN